jgi:hypothetical protein
MRASFMEWVRQRSKADDTFNKWAQYIDTVERYLMLYHGTQTRNWNMRMVAVKRLGPYFRAFDRTWYQRLIPQHLALLARTPEPIMDFFRKGGFAVNVWGEQSRGDALDGLHECGVNRSMKAHITRPTVALIEKRVRQLPRISAAVEDFCGSVAIEMGYQRVSTDPIAAYVKWDRNVTMAIKLFTEGGVFRTATGTNRGLMNVFDNRPTAAKADVARDVLHCYEVGETAFDELVHFEYLQRAHAGPANVYMKALGLKTMEKKGTSARQKKAVDVARELDRVAQHRVLMHAVETGEPVDPAMLLGQATSVPYAIFKDPNVPRKGDKWVFRNLLLGQTGSDAANQKYFGKANGLDVEIVPPTDAQCFVFDAMHKVHRIIPQPEMKTFGQLIEMVYRSWLKPVLRLHNCESVHMVFDAVRHASGSKSMCQRERDGKVGDSDEGTIDVAVIDMDTPLPRKSAWTKFIHNRSMKKMLVAFLCAYLGVVAGPDLRAGQEVITAGGFADDSARRTVCNAGTVESETVMTFKCNHSEADTSTFLHAKRSGFMNVVVHSADTDAVFIGLLAQDDIDRSSQGTVQGVHLYLQFKTRAHTKPAEYLDLRQLKNMVINMRTFGAVPETFRVRTLVALFVCFGCDFVSFFSQLPHGKFLEEFVKNAEFVVAGEAMCLGNWAGPTSGCFESFSRLVACGYFQASKAFMPGRSSPAGMYANAAAAALAHAAAAPAPAPAPVDVAVRVTTAADAPAQGVVAAAAAQGAGAGAGAVLEPGTEGLESLIPCDAALQWFLDDVRRGTLFKCTDLPGRMPTVGALWFHFLRALAVLERWAQWNATDVVEQPITARGLVTLPDGRVGCRHDTDELELRVKTTQNYLMKGCHCTTGCVKRSCICLRAKLPCGPMCHRKALKAGVAFCACANVAGRHAGRHAAPAEQQAAGGGVHVMAGDADMGVPDVEAEEDTELAGDEGAEGCGDRETDEGNFICGQCEDESCEDECQQCLRTIVPPGVREEQEAADASDTDDDDAADSSSDDDETLEHVRQRVRGGGRNG